MEQFAIEVAERLAELIEEYGDKTQDTHGPRYMVQRPGQGHGPATSFIVHVGYPDYVELRVEVNSDVWPGA